MSSTSCFTPSMGTSVLPVLAQAATRSFRHSAGQKGAGLGTKAGCPLQASPGPCAEGTQEAAQLLMAKLGPMEGLRALIGLELKGRAGVQQGWGRWAEPGKGEARTHCFCGQPCADSGSPA